MFNFPLPIDNTKVTVELRELVENGIDVWAFDYPSYYKGEQKAAFEQKVIDHYYFRQIGQETPARWLHYFRARIREVMPYYIQLYESEALMHSIEDPFGNVDITETFEEERSVHSTGTLNSETTGSSTDTTTGSSSGTDTTTETLTEDKEHKYSNTPQGAISNLDSYLTEAAVDNNETATQQEKESSASTQATSTGSASGTREDSSVGTEEGTTRHTYTKKGNQGVNTYAHDMRELRETFLNIDLMIINELKDLFIQIY